MIEITNNTRQSMAFVTGQKDGEATFDVVEAGETKTVSVEADDTIVMGRQHVGAITVKPGSAVRRRPPSDAE